MANHAFPPNAHGHVPQQHFGMHPMQPGQPMTAPTHPQQAWPQSQSQSQPYAQAPSQPVSRPQYPAPIPTPMPRAYPSPIPVSPFSLEQGRDEDVAVFQDSRIGFSHLLPGRPAAGQGHDPNADAVVHLQDAPVTIRYKLEPTPARTGSSAEIARLSAELFVSWRAQAAVRVDFANPSWLLLWGADAAAIATYDVASSDPVMHEDLFVLHRQGMTLLITWSYPKTFLDDPAYAAFASIAEATMVWDPTRWEQRGRIWPESAFVRPGLSTQATPKYVDSVRWVSEIAIPDTERTRALGVLANIASNIGAPWVELSHGVLERNCLALTAALRSREIHAFLQTAFADIRTAHDLRGLVVLLGRALDTRRSSSVRPPAMKHLVRG